MQYVCVWAVQSPSLTTPEMWSLISWSRGAVVSERLLAGPFLWGMSTAFLGASTAYIALLFGRSPYRPIQQCEFGGASTISVQ
jgi:hypothetical protein